MQCPAVRRQMFFGFSVRVVSFSAKAAMYAGIKSDVYGLAMPTHYLANVN